MSEKEEKQSDGVNDLHLALDMTNLSSGGSISVLLRYMKLWSAHGIRMTVFYVRETIGSEISAAHLPVTLIRIGEGWPSWKIFLYRNFRLAKLIRKSGAQILYCVNSMLFRCPVPQIVHMRNLQHFNSKSFWEQLTSGGPYEALRDWTCRYSVRKAGYDVFISENLRDAAFKQCRPEHPEGVFVIYNPVSQKLLQIMNENKTRPGKNQESAMILGVMNDYPHKDVPTFLRTLAALRRTIPERNWHGVILGNGSWEKYNRMAEELQLTGHIEFPGYVSAENIDEYYQKAFCLLATSRLESFNNTPLEAMACSCPAVITRCCAHPEIAGEAALYFTPGMEHEAAEQIRALCHSPEIYIRQVQKGYENLNRFLPENSVQKFEEIFKMITNKQQGVTHV